MHVIDVYIVSPRYHCSQVTVGLLMLASRLDGLEVRFHDAQSEHRGEPEWKVPVVLAEADGARLIYDLEDGYWTRKRMAELLDGCDFYFKRSLNREVNAQYFTEEQRAKMHPLGLNYFVDWPRNPYAYGMYPYTQHAMGSLSILVRRALRGRMLPARFEREPREPSERPTLIFSTRLWDPSEVEGESRADREHVNEVRLELMRALRESFGDRFCGGIVDGTMARRVCPELIQPVTATRRSAYLRSMHAADVCVTSVGLHGSVGGRLGEFVAASKAIVTDPLGCELPGNFAEGTNYLSYRSADECVERVRELMGNRAAIVAMQEANQRYYQAYLRPDMLVGNTLVRAGILTESDLKGKER